MLACDSHGGMILISGDQLVVGWGGILRLSNVSTSSSIWSFVDCGTCQRTTPEHPKTVFSFRQCLSLTKQIDA